MVLQKQRSLSDYGISVLKELKNYSIIQLHSRNESLKLSRGLYDKLLAAVTKADYLRESKQLGEDASFGVELEFIGTKDRLGFSRFSTGMYKLVDDRFIHTSVYTHNNGDLWTLGKDGSISLSGLPHPIIPPNPFGYELSSPVLSLSNDKDIDTLRSIIDLIKTHLSGVVNSSCGTHIHLSFTPDKITRYDISALLETYSSMESKIFDPIVPITRRRNRYCKKTTNDIREKYQKVSTRYCTFKYIPDFDFVCTNFHFEFRQLEGTLDADTLLYWIRLHACILKDLLDHINDSSYLKMIADMNAFDILFYYGFGNDMVSFFINRIIKFKSRTI